MNLIEDDTLRNLDTYLTAIERKEDITIVAAWVMGSHARNVANEGSDIDIRFVFVQPLEHYPSLTLHKESLRLKESQLQNGVPYASQIDAEDLEFMGWNASRFLELLGDREDGNNPSAIECLCSPLTIRTQPAIAELHEYVDARFNIIEMFKHYRGLSTRQWRKYIEDDSEPTVKRLLYILRGVVYAKYIRETHDLPTLDLVEFADTAPDSVFSTIDRNQFKSLIQMKAEGRGHEEIDASQFSAAIDAFRETDLEEFYPEHIRDTTLNPEDLDEYMFQLIRESQ